MSEKTSKADSALRSVLEDQMQLLREAFEKQRRMSYGPTDAMQDTQRGAANAMRIWMELARLGWQGWPTLFELWRQDGGWVADGGTANANAKAEVRVRYEECRAAFDRRDAQAVASYYAPEVVDWKEYTPTSIGRKQLEKSFAGLFQLPGLESRYSADKWEVTPSGDMVCEFGTIYLKHSGVPGQLPPVDWQGRYMVIWQKVDGEWLMTFDMTNSQEFPPPPDLEKAKMEIRSQYAECQAAFARRDAKATASFYAPDVVQWNEYTETTVGRKALEKGFAGLFTLPDLEACYTADRLELSPGGNQACEFGTIFLKHSGVPPNVPALEWEGRYMVIWQKVDGEWLMTFDMTNSQAPPTPPPSKTAARSRKKSGSSASGK